MFSAINVEVVEGCPRIPVKLFTLMFPCGSLLACRLVSDARAHFSLIVNSSPNDSNNFVTLHSSSSFLLISKRNSCEDLDIIIGERIALQLLLGTPTDFNCVLLLLSYHIKARRPCKFSFEPMFGRSMRLSMWCEMITCLFPKRFSSRSIASS